MGQKNDDQLIERRKMKIIEAYQVPEGNVSPDIFKLPCVVGADKTDDGVTYICDVNIDNDTYNDFDIVEASVFDWICKDSEGMWNILTNDEYQRVKSGSDERTNNT